MLTAWSRPVRSPLAAGPSPEAGVSAQAENEWLVDYSAAEAAGMAVTVPLGDQLAGRTLDALVVLGVRAATPDGALATLLDAHHYTRGLRLAQAGTPTNNTTTARSGHSSRRDAERALAVERGAPTDSGARMAVRLGVEPRVLAHVDAPVPDDTDHSAMRDVLRLAGGALYERLREQSGPAAAASLWNEVRPTGELAALVVGSQPYGVLAATALGRWVPADGDAAAVAVAAAWPAWRTLASEPRARTAWTAPLADIVTEHATSTHYTLAGGAELETVGAAGPDGRLADPYLEAIAASTPGARPPVLLARLAAAAFEAAAPEERPSLQVSLRHLANLSAERLHDLLASALDVLSHRFDAWATAIADQRLAGLDGSPRVLGAYGIVHAPRPRTIEPKTEGYIHAPSLGHAATAAVLRSGYAARSGDDALAIDLSSDRVRKALWLLDGVRHEQPLGALLGYRFERELSDAGLNRYIAEFRKLVRFRGTGVLATLQAEREDATRARLAAESEQRRRDGQRRGRRSGGGGRAHALGDAEAQRAIALTAVAPFHQRVNDLVAAEGGVTTAVALGGGARQGQTASRASTSSSSRGRRAASPSRSRAPISAPSSRRGGWRTGRTSPRGSRRSSSATTSNGSSTARSRRARPPRRTWRAARRRSKPRACALTAAETATGLANEAATGHRTTVLDPAVSREQSAIVGLADELRRQWAEATTTTAVTAVVDGLELRRRFRAAAPDASAPKWDATTIPFPPAATTVSEAGIDLPVQNTPDYARTLTVLRDLDDHVDAVCDLLVAEGVHQLVQGNPTRAGAALDALSDGRVPADVDVIRTPRPGSDVSHRVVVLLDREQPPLWGADSGSYRALVEPALDAWVSRLLPDPAGAACLVTDPDGKPLTFTLDMLGLSALDLLYVTADELEQRIAHQFAAAPGLTIDLDPPADEGPTAADLLSAAAAVRALLMVARPLRESDLGADTGAAATDLEARVGALRDRVDELARRLTEAPEAELVGLLFEAARCGLAEAVPPLRSGVVDPSVHAASAARMLAERLSAHDEIAPAAGVAALLERATALIGRELLVLPELDATLDPLTLADLGTAPNTRLGVEGHATLRRWLADVARVRPAVAELLTGLGQAEAFAAPERLRVRLTQLPPRTDDRWVALRGGAQRGTGVVAHVPEQGVPTRLCGLVVDDWTETIPGGMHLTGVAVHCDQPGAAAPQAIIVAVPPDTRASKPLPAWDLDTLIETVVGTLDLARLRVTAPDRLAGAVPMGAQIPSGLFP